MWVALACIGLGMSGLAPASQTAGGNAPVAAKRAVLDLMSLDSPDCTLKLEHHWGGISANHVYFENHDGRFEAIVEPSPNGVRVTFNGWEEHPFVATAARMRVIYRRPGADPVDVVAEALPGGKVRIRPAGRPTVQGEKISIRLGGPEVQYFPSHPK
jgi:hypothetical protein